MIHSAAFRVAVALALGSALLAGSSTASSAVPIAVGEEARVAKTPGRACARAFDRTLEAYVDTTRRRDAAGFNRLLDPDVTVVLANGGVVSGKRDVSAFIDDFFADPAWNQTFTELGRHVEGCRTAFVLWDSVYSRPAEQRVSPLVIGVTFTYRHGRWRVLHNQDSDGPASG